MNPHTYEDLGHQLAQHEYAVLRYAKIGLGTGAIVVDEKRAAEHRIFPQQQYIAAAACKKIRELVPQAKGLAIAGHSEGSVHGLVLAQRLDLGIDAFISLSGPAYRYIDLFVHLARKLSEEL